MIEEVLEKFYRQHTACGLTFAERVALQAHQRAKSRSPRRHSEHERVLRLAKREARRAAADKLIADAQPAMPLQTGLLPVPEPLESIAKSLRLRFVAGKVG